MSHEIAKDLKRGSWPSYTQIKFRRFVEKVSRRKLEHVICQLDVLKTVAGDARDLAQKLGFSDTIYSRLAQSNGSQSMALLTEWSTQQDSTVGKLLDALLAIERFDVHEDLVELIKTMEWKEDGVYTRNQKSQDGKTISN